MNTSEYNKADIKLSIISIVLTFISIIVSSYVVYNSVTKTFEKTLEVNRFEDNKQIASSAKIVLLEVLRINDISAKKYNDSAIVLNNLTTNKFNKVPLYDLNGQFTLLSESDWTNHLSLVLNKITPDDYIYLQNYYTIFHKLDNEYPIKSFNQKINTNNKQDSIFWWKSFRSVVNIYENSQNKKELSDIVNKLIKISKSN